MGVTVEQAADGLGEAGADLVGSNCGIGIEAMIGVAREFKKHTPLPIVIQPNAGLPQHRGGRVVRVRVIGLTYVNHCSAVKLNRLKMLTSLDQNGAWAGAEATPFSAADVDPPV